MQLLLRLFKSKSSVVLVKEVRRLHEFGRWVRFFSQNDAVLHIAIGSDDNH